MWWSQKISLFGELDLDAGKPSGVTHAVRAESVDVHSSAGTISFRVNSGGAADIYRVWMGDKCVFSMGNPFLGTDHKQNYNDAGFGFAEEDGQLQDLQVKE